jgi:hypothetical protein
MVDNDMLVYKEDNDNYGGREHGGNLLIRTDLETFINEETAEPDIMYWCQDSQEATMLLRKCIKMMNDKHWPTMIKYLKEIGI